jgi:hypothetical protein
MNLLFVVMGNCFSCGLKLSWNVASFDSLSIQGLLHRRIPPEDMTKKDWMCKKCVVKLPKKNSSTKESEKNNTEYNITEQKMYGYDYVNEHNVAYYFKISNCLKNGNVIESVNDIQLRSTYEFVYWVNLHHNGFRSNKILHQFLDDEFSEVGESRDLKFTRTIPETIQFDSTTGKLIIDDDKNDHYEIQLKFKSQIGILDRFLSFVNLRKNKINDKTIQEIKLKNHSEKIMLEKNNIKLHEGEEILSNFIGTKKETWTKDKNVIIKYEKYCITNFRIINEVWCNPVFFTKYSVNDVKQPLIFNFTHDEYDDVIASNIEQTTSSTSTRTGGVNAVSIYGFGVNQDTHSYQGMTTGNESGDITFMSKGKKLLAWDHFKDPKGIVEMIKSAKAQFESQDDKIPEPQVSSSDDDPLKILKVRLAKGEITLEEFEKLKSVL